MSRTEIIDRMADVVRTMGENGIAVTAESLHEHSNFTRAEIKEFAAEAADRARALVVREAA